MIHTAFDYDFSRFAENCEKDRRVIRTIGSVLRGSDRPFIITSVIGMGSADPGQFAVERVVDRQHANPRAASEQADGEIAAQGASVQGASVAVVRLPQVHDVVKQGLITPLIEVAREGRIRICRRWRRTSAEPVGSE